MSWRSMQIIRWHFQDTQINELIDVLILYANDGPQDEMFLHLLGVRTHPGVINVWRAITSHSRDQALQTHHNRPSRRLH